MAISAYDLNHRAEKSRSGWKMAGNVFPFMGYPLAGSMRFNPGAAFAVKNNKY